MLKSLKKHNIYTAPFVAVKDWKLSNIDNDSLILTEDDEGVDVDFVDYGDGSGNPVLNTECLIALEQQDDDKLTFREGKKGSGIFYPDNEPQNADGTFQRVVYAQIQTTFYNDYRNPTQIWGLENIDFPKSKTVKSLADTMRIFAAPTRVFGEKIIENTVEIIDNSLDNKFSISDDGNNNLYASHDIFSKFQEVGGFENEFATGSIDNCAAYFNFSVPELPVSLSASSGSAVLNWLNPSASSLILGYGIEKSLDSGSTYSLLRLVSGDRVTTGSVDTDVSNNNTYYYRVYSFNNFGSSGYSNTSSITFADIQIAAQAALLLWADANDITGSSDGDFLSSWRDKSSFNWAITGSSTVTTTRPIYKTNQLGGKPAVKFGSGSFSVQKFIQGSTTMSFSSSEMFIVLRSSTDPRPGATFNGPLTFNTGGDMAYPYIENVLVNPTGGASLYDTFGSSNNPAVHNNIRKPTYMSGTFRVINSVSENAHKALYYDGELIYSRDINSVGIGNPGSHSIGDSLSALRWPGDIAELMIYTRSLTAAERLQNNQYLASKYGKTFIVDTASYSPSSIPGIQGWWDATQITGLSGSQTISGTIDRSGYNRVWTQSVEANRPTYITGAYQGKPAMRFTTTRYFTTFEFTRPVNGQFTLIAICKPTAANSSVVGHTVNSMQFRVGRGGANVLNFFPGSAEAVSIGFTHPYQTLQMNVWQRTADGSSINFWQNGTFDESGGGGSTGALTWNAAGFSADGVPFVGDITELCWYTQSLSREQIFKLYEYYFRTKWGLPGTT